MSNDLPGLLVEDTISQTDSIDLSMIQDLEKIAPKEEIAPPAIIEEKTDIKETKTEEMVAKSSEADKNKEKNPQQNKAEKEPETAKSTKKTKESKIGVDRKLVSGIPGTYNYKGKFPSHNVKEKGSITISYEVDKNGNVISARRISGLKDNNTINNAITMIKKYVKAEKSSGNSTGNYTISFK